MLRIATLTRNIQGGDGAQCGLQNLTCQHSPQIALDAIAGDGEEDEQKAQQQTYYTVAEGLRSLSQSVQDTAKGAGNVHERADKAENQDKAAGQLRMEEYLSCQASKQQENGGAAKAQEQTVANGGQYGPSDGGPVSVGIRFRHNR